MSRRILAGSMALILLSACDFLDTLRERLQILGVDFGFERLDVGALAFESDPVEAAIDLANFDATARGKYGVDERCRIRATNPNTHAAAFDGADVRLRLEDTSRSAPSVPARLPAFRVPAGGDTVLDITFPMRLDNPVFSRSAWTKAVRGEDMPYRLDADLFFRLLDESSPGASLGSGSVRLDVAKGAVDARAAASTAVDLLLQALAVLFG
jgi:hypothetical protein